MKLRTVLTATGPCVEALKTDGTAWVRLSSLANLELIGQRFGVVDLATSLLAVLTLGYDGWQFLLEQVDSSSNSAAEALIICPFKPLSFRDFALFEQHLVDASRGFTKRFLPNTYKLTTLYETLTRTTFPRFKPSRLWYQKPLYYWGNHLNFITSGDAIYQPRYTKALDYELEVGAILAKPLLNASPDEAQQAIGGYVVLNDVSARDIQRAEMNSGFGPQKAKHFINAMSSIVVTADEINDHINALNAAVIIDGIERVICSTRNMQYSLGEAIAHASHEEQLYAGELFGSGTLPGGCGLENGHWIYPGNVISLKIDKIAEVTNKIVSER
jgi:2-keto-4-pentenoate hydratase/2-oxohepta-3-ene-1,7-dioic acid hydratase in catechol pathway